MAYGPTGGLGVWGWTSPAPDWNWNWHQMLPICLEWWCTEANEATKTQCYNTVVPAYPVWAYYAHGRQRRCQEIFVSLPSSRLEKTTRLSPHHVAQHRPTGLETTPPYAPWSSRFGSEPPSVEDGWCWRMALCNLACQKRRWQMLISTCSALGRQLHASKLIVLAVLTSVAPHYKSK